MRALKDGEFRMDLYALLDEIQAIARDGLAFSSDPYDRERYERLLDLATQTYSELLDVPEGKLRERFLKEIGYITPKVGSTLPFLTRAGKSCSWIGWMEAGGVCPAGGSSPMRGRGRQSSGRCGRRQGCKSRSGSS